MSILHSTLPGTVEDRARAAVQRLEPIAEIYPYRPRFVEHDGVFQHYLDEGPRDGETLLCLHGNPTWSFFWRTLVNGVSDRYRCIAPDHVGCGLSDKPTEYAYRLEQHVANVERLVEELELKDITLVLHDWGGAIGMGFARRHPELVRRLVFLNTAAFRAERIPKRIAVCRIPVLGKVCVQGFNAFARAATFMTVEKPLAPLVKRGYLLPYDTFDNRRATLAFVEDIPMAPGHPSYRELVAIEESLSTFRDRPTLLVWGERDWCFTPAFRAEFERRLPQAETRRFEEAGHYVLEDAGDEAVEAVRSFLQSHPLGA